MNAKPVVPVERRPVPSADCSRELGARERAPLHRRRRYPRLMKDEQLLRVTTRAQWRAWLERNHQKARGIWLVYVKTHTGRQQLSYAAAVEEALCFGWIDTTVRTLDDEHYTQRFTPRTNLTNWSQINLERFARMEAEGKMTDAGRAKKPRGVKPPPRRIQASDPIPPFILNALAEHPQARAFFETLAPGYRRNYVRYISEAKKEETRTRRLEQAIRMLNDGVKEVF
jgi:uncharacterized protein YdeI (YjbR/CyaY-like superfamily)